VIVNSLDDLVKELNGVWPEEEQDHVEITYQGKAVFLRQGCSVKTPTIAKFSKQEFIEKAKTMQEQTHKMSFKLRIQVGLLNTQAIISCDNKAVIDDINDCGFDTWAIYSEFDLLRLSEGLYDVEGTVEYVDGGLEYGELKVADVCDEKELTAKDAMQILKKEMQSEGSDAGSYAHSWHCNIAMAAFYSLSVLISDHDKLRDRSNEAASRFMKLCFDVRTKA